MKNKAKEWLKRYLPSEIVGTLTALTGASLANIFSENLIFIAYVGSISEAIGFYSTVFIQAVFQKNKTKNYKFSISNFLKIINDIVLEFGPAGLIDGLLLRPFFLYIFPLIMKNFTLGILIGKIVGDLAFYFLVILCYEIIKFKKALTTNSNESK